MSQIQQAVDIANSSSASGELKKQALDFLHQLKSSGEAVNVFSQYLHDSSASDVGRFFALQVLSEQAQAASPGANQETLFAWRQTGLEFLRKQLEAGDGEGNSSINSSNNNVIPFKMILQVVTQRTWPQCQFIEGRIKRYNTR